MPLNKIESALLDSTRENYIGVLKGVVPIGDSGWTTYADTVPSPSSAPVDGEIGRAHV